MQNVVLGKDTWPHRQPYLFDTVSCTNGRRPARDIRRHSPNGIHRDSSRDWSECNVMTDDRTLAEPERPPENTMESQASERRRCGRALCSPSDPAKHGRLEHLGPLCPASHDLSFSLGALTLKVWGFSVQSNGRDGVFLSLPMMMTRTSLRKLPLGIHLTHCVRPDRDRKAICVRWVCISIPPSGGSSSHGNAKVM